MRKLINKIFSVPDGYILELSYCYNNLIKNFYIKQFLFRLLLLSKSADSHGIWGHNLIKPLWTVNTW